MTRALPVTVIGGYLGAGKTTLLNNLLSEADGERVAVLVNDFGEINVDAGLIAGHDGETISLANGCLCCSLANGLASAIADVLKRADRLDRIVIEASGVAEPGKIAQYGEMFGLPVDAILVLVDAEQIVTQAANKYVGDTVLRQLAQADLLVVNKTDLVGAAELAGLSDWLRQRTGGTPLIATAYARLVPTFLFLRGETHRRAPLSRFQADHGAPYRTWLIERDRPVAREAFERFAGRLARTIPRAKGFVRFADNPTHAYLFQQVGRRWMLDDLGPQTPPGRTELVLIATRGAG